MGRNRIHPKTGTTQTAVRIPDRLNEQFKKIAERECWSNNQALIEAIKLLIKEYS